jgi:hypothetical protein
MSLLRRVAMRALAKGGWAASDAVARSDQEKKGGERDDHELAQPARGRPSASDGRDDAPIVASICGGVTAPTRELEPVQSHRPPVAQEMHS